ncbi:hypothetical protein DL346_15785 [Paenibacillus montanisoli]|uniref:Uncharacterized protein n=1 Tax=Paenibacillus montanisoli TaxID=2081970 RepID=A0A328U1X3_9BACL|nr:hypothetical protein DL346_15785 [Paenibacillus montanisoli]
MEVTLMAARKRKKTGIVRRKSSRVRRRSRIRKSRRAFRLGRKKLRRGRRTVSLVSANKYNRFFLPPHRTIRLKVQPRIWDRIAAELPPTYLAPDIDFVNHMKQFS